MKTIFIVLCLLSYGAFAQEVPQGIFQIDATQSTLMTKGHQKKLSGLINLKEKFSDSTFRIETGDSVFESFSVKGELQNFEVKGTVKAHGDSRRITLRGTFFGTIEQAEGFVRIVLKLESGTSVSSIFAQKPKVSSTELHKTVMDIIQ